jgi:hypothetical protein
VPPVITGAAPGRAQFSRMRERAARLFHHAEQRTPGLVLRLLGTGGGFAGSAPQYFVAQCLQFDIVDAFELHPQIEDDDRQQLDRLAAVAFAENSPTLLKRLEHRLQLFVLMRHRRSFC